MDINIFYNVLKDLHSEFDKKRQSIQFDADLSPDGKAKRLGKLDENRVKAVSQLQESFETAYNKELATLDKKLNVQKESHVDTAREILKGELVKAVNLGELDKKYITLDDNNKTQLILNAIESTHKERMSFAKAQARAMRDIEWIRKDIQKAMNASDVDKLEEYQQVAELMPNGQDSDSLIDILTPAIAKSKLDRMTPEQRQASGDKQTLERDRELLNYSFENVSQRNEYVDARQVSRDTPVNTLTYQGGSDRVLGQAPIQRQFSQYKTNK